MAAVVLSTSRKLSRLRSSSSFSVITVTVWGMSCSACWPFPNVVSVARKVLFGFDFLGDGLFFHRDGWQGFVGVRGHWLGHGFRRACKKQGTQWKHGGWECQWLVV